jgi:1,4-alpha-glucan branching enzyme
MKKSRLNAKKRVEFKLRTEPEKNVFVAGTFNDWDPRQTKLEEKETGIYTGALRVPVGRHEYKFVVDSDWWIDPDNSEVSPNSFGSMNSVMTVK